MDRYKGLINLRKHRVVNLLKILLKQVYGSKDLKDQVDKDFKIKGLYRILV